MNIEFIAQAVKLHSELRWLRTVLIRITVRYRGCLEYFSFKHGF